MALVLRILVSRLLMKFDFEFGTAFDTGFSNFEGLVTAKFDNESIGDWSGGSGRPHQRRCV